MTPPVATSLDSAEIVVGFHESVVSGASVVASLSWRLLLPTGHREFSLLIFHCRQVFFYKAVLTDWSAEPPADQVPDYCWVTGSELRSRLRPSYGRAVLRLLADHD